MSRPSTIVFLIILTIFIESARSRPVEPPTKFSLDTSPGSTERAFTTKWKQGKELIERVGDALRLGTGKLVHSAAVARNVIVERAEDLTNEARNNVASVLSTKNDILAQGSTAINSFVSAVPTEINSVTKTRETIKLENENAQSLLERPMPNPIGQFLESYIKPIPLVDKIRNDEKYGNSGDKFIGVGRALVGGLESLSNILNAILDFPIDTAKKTSRGLTEALNQLGGRLIGLQ